MAEMQRPRGLSREKFLEVLEGVSKDDYLNRVARFGLKETREQDEKIKDLFRD